MASASASDPRTEVATQIAVSHLPALEVGLATDPGKMPEKQVNEDSALVRNTRHGHLAVVCDGMGGHVGGKEASNIAVDTIFRVVDAAPGGTPAEILAEAIREANRAIFNKGTTAPELKGMGSTCVAVLTHPGGSEVAHVGDSRVYLLTQNQVYQVTKDHSLVQRLVDANMLTPEEAPNHPSANQITNALGMKPEVEVEVRPQPFPHTAGDTFILCSDGLSDEIGPQDIANILAPYPSCEQAAKQMVDLANARGGHDNITVAIVRLAGGGPFAPTIPTSRAPTPIAGTPLVQTGGTTQDMPVLPEARMSANATMAQAPLPIHSAITPPMGASAPSPIGAAPQAAPPYVAPAFGPPPPVPGPQINTAPHVPTFSATPISQRIEPASGRKGNGVLIAVIIVLLLALAGVGVAWYLEHEKPTATEPPKAIIDEEPTAEPTKTTKKSATPIAPLGSSDEVTDAAPAASSGKKPIKGTGPDGTKTVVPPGTTPLDTSKTEQPPPLPEPTGSSKTPPDDPTKKHPTE
jgi:serine/threonine protein phosphatase PrpC